MWSARSSIHHEGTKKTKAKLIFVFFVIFVSSWFLIAHAQSSAPAREIDNVAAFARLYGVLRFFYPSDAAASLDWNRFAIDGVARARTAGDTAALASRLRELVSGLGPGIDIGTTLTAYRQPVPSTDSLVAWRYVGAGPTDRVGAGPYAAKRTNRVRQVNTPVDGFAGFGQLFAALELRGKAIRLRAQVKATALDPAGGGALWLRVDRPQGTGFFDNMGDRLVRNDTW